jgi:hypothetical protein
VKTVVRTAHFLATVAAGILLAGCHTPNRQVTTRVFLDRGTVAPRQNQTIWESSAMMADSDVTVTYRGSDGCPARLVTGKVSERGQHVSSKAQQTDPTGADTVTVKLRGAQAVCLICGDGNNTNAAGECAYVVEEVNSSHGARVLDATVMPGITLTNVMVAVGQPAQPLWQSPVTDEGSAGGCHVTVRVYDVGRGRAVLNYQSANGVRRQLVVTEPHEVVTLNNVVKISLGCMGAADGRCAAEVLQTDCPQ